MKNRIMPMIVSAAFAASVVGSSSALAEIGKAEYGSLTVAVCNEDEGGSYTDEHKQLAQNVPSENTEEISYKIVRLPDKVEYKLGESISLKGIQVEMKKGDEEPIVYTYPDVAFDYQSNIPKAPTVILHSDFRSDKAGTYKVEVVGADNVSFDVKVVDDTSLSDTTGTFPVTAQTVVTATTTAADPEIKDPAVFTEGEMMTLDDVIELSKKGKALTLKDFAKFKGVIAGSGILILEYDFGGGCFLTVGSIEPYHIDYAILRYPGCEKSIDIRTDDVEAYLAEMKAQNDPAANNGKKKMTLYDVMEFARMGDILDWSDFDEYVGEDGWHGTGMYTHTYSFDLGDGFVLYVGGNQPARPETIFLYRYDPENGMDIREEGINNFIYITADQLMNVKVLEINGDTLLVRADDCSGELMTLPTKYLDSDVVPKAGMKLEVTYVGGILQTYPAQFGEVKKVSVIQNGIPMDGDANCDGSVDLADAILIMQALANPNKYGIDGTAEHHLTSLGRIKADMDGNGLTVDDALAIQLKLLGLSDNAADPDITVFGLTPSKTGVKEFLADNPTVKSSYQGDELFNVTPEEISDRYNFRIFKYSSDCESYLEYNGKTYHIGTGFGGFGTVSFAVADIDANGSPELYFTYSFGSGIHASDISYFDFATETVSELEFYYERGLTDQSFGYEVRDLAFAVNDNRLEIYSAVTNGNSFVNLEVELKEKLGEITSDNGAIKAAGQGIDSSLIANKLFIYEKETALGVYDISFGDNGKYYCNQGNLDAARDIGKWTISGDTVVLTGKFGTNRFSFKDDALIYIAEGSDGFNDFKPKDGEKFTLAPERTYDAKTMSINGITISIKSDFRPHMSDMSGIGILIEVDSPDFPITLKADDGYFRIDDTEKGAGRFIDVGKTCEAGKSGRVFWAPDELYYQEGFESEIQVIGVSGDVFIDLGRIYVAQVKGGIFEASFEKSGSTAVIAGNTFVYEKEGTGSEFTITFNTDGTFEYYTGVLSSYLGAGTWEIKDDTVTMTESTSTKVNYLKINGSDLIYIAEGSDNFYGIRVKDGEKFFVKADSENSLTE